MSWSFPKSVILLKQWIKREVVQRIYSDDSEDKQKVYGLGHEYQVYIYQG